MTSEPVGSLAEEAARLIAALQGWAQDQRPRGGAEEGGTDGAGSPEHEHTHPDPLAFECRYCPLCTIARVAKATTPEVRDHLASAALSLALAVKGLLDNTQPEQQRRSPVEKIDIEDES